MSKLIDTPFKFEHSTRGTNPYVKVYYPTTAIGKKVTVHTDMPFRRRSDAEAEGILLQTEADAIAKEQERLYQIELERRAASQEQAKLELATLTAEAERLLNEQTPSTEFYS